MTKEEFKQLAEKHLYILDGYRLDKDGNKEMEIYGFDKLYEQLNLTDVNQQHELLKGFMQYVNCTDTTNHIYGHLLDDYLKTLNCD